MNDERAPVRAADAIAIDFDGETIVYDRQTGEVHRLDAVGSIVWNLLDGEATVDELVSDLSAAFAAEPGLIRRDMERLLARLEEAFLLGDSPVANPSIEPRLLTNPPSP